MGSRGVYQSGPSVFKKLVRLVARAFYFGPCPPKAEGQTGKRKWDKVDTTGIAVVLLDYLAQKEWVKEEHLLEELKLAPKLVLKALRYLEEEKILRHESRKEGKRAQNKDIVIQVTKKEDGSDGTDDGRPKPIQQSYWAIDYPSFWDALRVRLYLMRFGIKAEVDDSSTVSRYICPTCGERYSLLDFTMLINREAGVLMCEACGVEVKEEFSQESGPGKVEDRRKRREEMKAMMQRMEQEMEVILDLVNQAKDIKPPDLGCLADWAAEANARKQAQSQKEGKRSEWDLSFGDDLAVKSPDTGATSSRVSEQKPLPPWLLSSSKSVPNKDRENGNRGLKRRIADILPPPDAPSPSKPDPKPVSLISIPPVDDDVMDGIQWEESEDETEILCDEETARRADVESDMRSHSGWTTTIL